MGSGKLLRFLMGIGGVSDPVLLISFRDGDTNNHPVAIPTVNL